jgi:formamidopyrimidine-DNA glycosylase
MIELPEAQVIAGQLNKALAKRKISKIIAGFTPHKLAWFYGDRGKYSDLLVGKTIGKAFASGGMVEVQAGKAIILFSEGVGIRFHERNQPRPARHQLLIEFEDGTAVSGSVQMYGGMGCFAEGGLDNPYYKVARDKPSPFSAAFGTAYFSRMIASPEVRKLSAKAFLATEQRIPGLGNGVLQDILFNAAIHPKKKVSAFSENDREKIYASIKTTLVDMKNLGGRDTETDLHGRRGGYRTILSKNTAGEPCPACGTRIKKESYLGGSIYYCEKCQSL